RRAASGPPLALSRRTRGPTQTRRLDQVRPARRPPRLVGSDRALHLLHHGRPPRFVPCPLDDGAAEHATAKDRNPTQTQQYSGAASVHRRLLLSLGLRG